MAGWDMFRELDNLKKEIDEVFRGAGYSGYLGPSLLSPAVTRRFPLVNITEDEGHLYIAALVPGVDVADIELSVLRNSITISGERKPVEIKQGEVLHRSELGSGRFSRTLELPVEIDTQNATAVSKNGILYLTVAKAEHARPKKIDIKLS